MKRVLIIITTLTFVSISIFGVVIPKILESRVPEMKEFLKDQGYKNSKVVDINGYQSQVTFKTDRGTVNVRTIKNGGFVIKY